MEIRLRSLLIDCNANGAKWADDVQAKVSAYYIASCEDASNASNASKVAVSSGAELDPCLRTC